MLQSRVYWVFILALALQACTTHKQQQVYTSECATDIVFKKISLSHLADSIKYYDKRYVEVSGRYVEGKNISALVNDSTFSDHGNSHSFWVNFTQDCPLYLTGKHTGLFAAEDGTYSNINNKLMTIRGRIEVQNKGYKKEYCATINEVSYLRFDQ
jgi:hypothetical protein